MKRGDNMTRKEDLQDWLIESLKAHNGSASIVEVCTYIWDNYEDELRRSGDLFFTWQYDIRWAAVALRENGIMRPADLSPRGTWELL